MKKIMIALGIIILVVLVIGITVIIGVRSDLASSPGEEMNQVTLEIADQPWSGWTKEQPASSSAIVVLGKNEAIDLGRRQPILEPYWRYADRGLKIKSINQNQIVIVTSGLAKSINGGIDLRAESTDIEFVIAKGDSVKLATQTVDAGNIYTITFVAASK